VLNDADLEEEVERIGRGRDELEGYLSEGPFPDTSQEDEVKEINVSVKVDDLERRRLGNE
jgi:hypothetical protein